MKKSKKRTALAIVGVLALALCIGTVTAYAAQDNAEALRAAANMTEREALVEMANATDIDIAGKSDDQLRTELREKKFENEAREAAMPPIPELASDGEMRELGAALIALGKAYEGKTSGEDLREYQAARAALEAAHPEAAREGLLEMAAYVGIDVTGITDQQIREALRAYKVSRGR